MYFWRTVAKGVRRIAPDAVMGLYTAEEITEGAVIEVKEVVKKEDDIPEDIATLLPEEKTENNGNSEGQEGEILKPKNTRGMAVKCPDTKKLVQWEKECNGCLIKKECSEWN